MEAFNSQLSELQFELVSITDGDPQFLSHEELIEAENKFVFLLSDLNSKAQKCREAGLTPREEAYITAKLESVEKLTSRAIEKIERLKTGGAKAKQIQPTVEIGPPPEIPTVFVPQTEPERPPSVTPSLAQSIPSIESVIVQSDPNMINVKMKSELIESIVEQIKSEFARYMKPEQSEPMVGAPITWSKEERDILNQIEKEQVGQPMNDPHRQPLVVHPDRLVDQNPVFQMKFDKVELLRFDGKDDGAWIPFRDQFVDFVHNNANLTKTSKLHQLQSHLSGQALERISGLQGEAGYDAAWAALLDRYDNKSLIVAGYIGRFFDLPILQGSQSYTRYLAMVDRTNQLLRVIPRFGYDVSHYDPVLIYWLTSRLDSATLRKWKDQIKKRSDITISELIEFLEVEAAESRNVHRDRPAAHTTSQSKRSKAPPKKASIFLTTEGSGECSHCNGDHVIYRCKAFMALTVNDRLKSVREAKLCLTCLRKHEKGECKSSACRSCGGSHNSLLCFKKERGAKAQVAAPKEK